MNVAYALEHSVCDTVVGWVSDKRQLSQAGPCPYWFEPSSFKRQMLKRHIQPCVRICLFLRFALSVLLHVFWSSVVRCTLLKIKSFWRINSLIIMTCCSLSVSIFLVLKHTLSNINIANTRLHLVWWSLHCTPFSIFKYAACRHFKIWDIIDILISGMQYNDFILVYIVKWLP